MTVLRGILITTSLLVFIWSCTATDPRGIDERTTALPVKRTGPTEGESAADAPSPSPTLNAVTINLAHGRKDSMNQLLVSEEQTPAFHPNILGHGGPGIILILA